MQKDEIMSINKSVLRYCSSKYELVNKYFLQNKRMREVIKCIYKFIEKNETFQYNGKNYDTFVITMEQLVEIVKPVKKRDTMCRYMNYLCFYGIFTKVRQKPTDEARLIQANKRFLELYPTFNPLGVYKVTCLDDEHLQAIESRLKVFSSSVTRSNISNKLLRSLKLDDIARDLYPNNTCSSLSDDLLSVDVYLYYLIKLVDEKGYCTKKELTNAFKKDNQTNKTHLKRIQDLAKSKIELKYKYAPPSKEEKENLHLEPSYRKYIYRKL